jgi:hypothetical protein
MPISTLATLSIGNRLAHQGNVCQSQRANARNTATSTATYVVTYAQRSAGGTCRAPNPRATLNSSTAVTHCKNVSDALLEGR